MWLAYNTLIVLAGTSMLGASCGILGTFSVLRRRALLGDALAHSTLPGIGLVYLACETRNVVWLLAGALASGLVGVGAISFLRRFTRLKEDSALGSVMGVFFAAGIVLFQYIDHHSASGGQAGLQASTTGKTAGMIGQDVYIIAAVSAAALLLVVLLYKEFKLVTFDGAFARIQGWPATLLDLFLAGLVAVTVVVGLLAMAAVLIAALLIIPAVVARFWTNRLSIMLLLAAACGACMGAGGTLLSARFDTLPAAPAIVLVGAVLFLFSALLAPSRGPVARWLSARRFQRLLDEQRLLLLLWQKSPGHDQSLPSRRGNGSLAHAASCLVRMQLLHPGVGHDLPVEQWELTSAGWKRAAQVARGQRLWRLALLRYPELARECADLDLESVDERLPAHVIAELQDDRVE